MNIEQLEKDLEHLPYRSSAWWRAAMTASGLRAVELLELIGDEIDHEDDESGGGIDVDAIIARELGR